MNGYCIRPVDRPTSYKMLKLSALQPHGLDLAETKYVDVSEKIAKRFHIRDGDLLICRSVGSFDHIAKCALAPGDRPDILFPDIMICARFDGSIVPAFAREVIQSPAGRAWFQRNARTAVGMWKIGGSDITNFPMPLPPLSVQLELVAEVAAQRAEIERFKADADRKSEKARMDVEAMILGDRIPS